MKLSGKQKTIIGSICAIVAALALAIGGLVGYDMGEARSVDSIGDVPGVVVPEVNVLRNGGEGSGEAVEESAEAE